MASLHAARDWKTEAGQYRARFVNLPRAPLRAVEHWPLGVLEHVSSPCHMTCSPNTWGLETRISRMIARFTSQVVMVLLSDVSTMNMTYSL